MSDKETGGPAFPNPRWEGWGSPQEGMTLRDYFATRAMQDFLASKLPLDVAAMYAYKAADEMLKARNQ